MSEVSVFASYAHDDDTATYGRISKIVEDVGKTYRSLTGSPVGVFKDTESISLGEAWRERIRAGLASSSILLAFISLAYLRSVPCREELREFLASSGRRLVIPLIFMDTARIADRFGGDELWSEIERIQYLAIQDLRSEEPGSSKWMIHIGKIAERIDDVLVEFAASAEEHEAEAASTADDATTSDQATLYPLLYALHVGQTDDRTVPWVIKRLDHLLKEFVSTEADAVTQLKHANTFGAKLAEARRLGARLTPIADETRKLATGLRSSLTALDSEARTLFVMVQAAPDGREATEARPLLATVQSLARQGMDAFSSLEELHTSVGGLVGLSGELDRPLKRLQAAIVTLAEARGICTGWQDELDVIAGAK